VRAVCDPNNLISALLSPRGAPGQVFGRWLSGDFELAVSDKLLDELDRALAYPKIRRHVDSAEAEQLVSLLRNGAILAADPSTVARRSTDPGDDYLLALAEAERALLVSGDRHLLELAPALPVVSARGFLETLTPES
jgi:hypothetical protein